MKIAVLRERRPGEKRVAATPETVKKMIGLGASVVIEKGAGLASSYLDEAYKDSGAKIAADAASALDGADIILKVQRPVLKGEQTGTDQLEKAKKGAFILALFSPYNNTKDLKVYAKQGLTTLALELVPRITRAQTMDVLSSQTNLAGYRAVIEAAYVYDRAFPMMMTAAGTIPPAKILILGAGVAGLQAVATAKRMGAVVSAFDVRAAAREQVESLGGTFISVESDEKGEGTGGYAKEMSADYQKRQADKIKATLEKSDIAITTALIPGKTAPRLITEDMIAVMKPGSVILDMAVESGGNCALSEPGKIVEKNGVQIIGYINLPSRIARDASALYARNVLNYLTLLIDKDSKKINLNFEDEIIAATTLTHGGEVVHPNFKA
ncbi:Re/Si-specific NAD(P)(+) transhydrogenase subunit alpha [Candidatus Nucleicultrix amoebiphila]|jgi:NAD(P) transhydrogenase subunit alpha|uniref:NAD(P) transhydrogenase subunit alpha part 1 n=1 Tax=Candidatus Nucleicultrix amoebiphila FS5 TaxID=1414854 RepID=A0A1W6N609_9PROT|nr:Re/Si-specific NAD(P)(+) transhydrogenase subunit alpha [Candidatus Nucleicultrix amoebiphila]ARN85166.1 NAD(P) transhydrogenase subunit alpha [Candidatus Nucleicultrix amoebiphila FS5]